MGSTAGEEDSTLIAIDTDRNSQRAVKWAVEHLVKNNSPCTLVHVKTKNSHHSTLLKLMPQTFDQCVMFLMNTI